MIKYSNRETKRPIGALVVAIILLIGVVNSVLLVPPGKWWVELLVVLGIGVAMFFGLAFGTKKKIWGLIGGGLMIGWLVIKRYASF